MKKLLFGLCVATLLCQQGVRADDLASLAGKWSVKKVSNEGQNITQIIEIKKDKFTFQILSADDSLVLYAEGDFNVEKLGPFSAARFTHIRGGGSASNLSDVDDVYVSIYVLDEDAWSMATNFDKQRDGQKPSLDVYHRTKASANSKSGK
jgi:hypothetical protein